MKLAATLSGIRPASGTPKKALGTNDAMCGLKASTLVTSSSDRITADATAFNIRTFDCNLYVPLPLKKGQDKDSLVLPAKNEAFSAASKSSKRHGQGL